MQKNWYIIYTKAKCEKKVTALLTKRKIDNFCPLNYKKVNNSRKTKFSFEPLFSSYVFAYLEESQLSIIKETENVLNILYWKGVPAIVTNEDIESIRQFTFDHVDIQVQRNRINSQSEEKMDTASYKKDGNLLMIKNRSFNKYLPSLGFILIAEIEMEKNRGLEISFGNKELRLQS